MVVIGDSEGVGDALVGGVGLAVDAVGVDLEQDGTLCTAGRATSVAGTPALSHKDTAAWRRSKCARQVASGTGLKRATSAYTVGSRATPPVQIRHPLQGVSRPADRQPAEQ